MSNFGCFWETLTEDKFILQVVKGAKLEFNDIPVQKIVPNEIKCSHKEKELIEAEIYKYREKHIISEVEHCPDEFISQIFPRDKKSGGVRIILNLSDLNKSVQYEHFKMEGLNTALSLIENNCYMASIDLTDAYFSVNVDPDFRNVFRFTWNKVLYELNCLPNGYSGAPRMFTKLLKPIFAKLRNEGFISVYYLDDTLLISKSYEDCMKNVEVTANIFSDAGFIINKEKSAMIPAQKIKILGFWLNSENMSITLPDDKVEKVLDLGKDLLSKNSIKIRDLAKFIGTVVSYLPAVKYGELFYSYLESNKIDALKKCRGNFDSFTSLSEESRKEVEWWLVNVKDSSQNIVFPPYEYVIFTDASMVGWGAVYGEESSGGKWLPEETENHINVLELKAILFGLGSFFDKLTATHIRIKSDNTTAVVYINNMGGVKSLTCHSVAKEIWIWAIERKIHLSAEHLPGSSNVLADKASRIFDENTEWELNVKFFRIIESRFGEREIDLFASRLNAKLRLYASWKPDPFAKFVDAFSADWRNLTFYAFPPFSMVIKCVQKIQRDLATGVLVVPLWPTQAWFPRIMQMLIDVLLVLPLNSLVLPFKKQARHKQHKTLRLVVCHLSGISTLTEDFQRNLPISSVPRGENPPLINTKFILGNGVISVVDRKLIPCHLVK